MADKCRRKISAVALAFRLPISNICHPLSSDVRPVSNTGIAGMLRSGMSWTARRSPRSPRGRRSSVGKAAGLHPGGQTGILEAPTRF
jgi:hypothetical protein